jgi:hypothetical protein
MSFENHLMDDSNNDGDDGELLSAGLLMDHYEIHSVIFGLTECGLFSKTEFFPFGCEC